MLPCPSQPVPAPPPRGPKPCPSSSHDLCSPALLCSGKKPLQLLETQEGSPTRVKAFPLVSVPSPGHPPVPRWCGRSCTPQVPAPGPLTPGSRWPTSALQEATPVPPEEGQALWAGGHHANREEIQLPHHSLLPAIHQLWYLQPAIEPLGPSVSSSVRESCCRAPYTVIGRMT